MYALTLLVLAFTFTAGLDVAVMAKSGEEQLPPLINRELFFGDPEISSSQLSPDGKFISFIKPYQDVRNIWVKGIDEPFDAAKPVTADDRPVPGYFWSRDGRYILYVQDKGGNENFHVYAVNPADEPKADTGVPSARDLTPLEDVRAIIYAVPENRPNEIIVGLNDRDPTYHDVYRIDITTGERELLIKNTEQIGFFFYDLEGNVRLAYRQLPDGGAEILRVDGDDLVQVYTTTFEESAFPIRYHKDGQRVYMSTNKGDDVNLSRLVLFNPETGQEEFVESDPEGQVDFGSAIFDNQTDELIATVYVGDRVRIYPKTEQVEKDLEILRSKLPEGELNLQSSTEDMRHHLVSVSRDVDPGSVYLYDRKTEEVELLYRSRPKLPSEHLATMKAIRYKVRDGLEIPAYLTLPKGVEPTSLPTVIHPHGGPWSRDSWGYDSYAQFLANRGYAVLQPNFRGSAGYGKEFLNAGNKEWGFGAMQHDITDGVKYLIQQGIADPDRIGIFGGSYGGYATLAGVTFTPDLYAAAVPYVAPSNLITLIESFPPYWGPFIKIWHKRVGDPEDEEDRADLIARSPLFKAEEIETPMLVVHGLNDPRVKKTESDQLVVALRERGLPVEYVVAPDEGHGFRAPENRLALAAAMERFLAKHLGGRYQEEMSEELSDKLAELTVDVNSVELPDETLLKYAETAPLPQRSAELIHPMQLSYAATMKVGEQQMEMDVEREVTEAVLKDTPVWKITSTRQSQMGAATETFFIDKETLLPIKRDAKQGPATIDLIYSDDKIQGMMKMGAQEIPIDIKTPAPVMPDGSALDVVLPALPLASDYETTIRVFDPLTQKVRPMSVTVAAKETVNVKAGSFDTYKVEMEPLDGDPGGSVQNVAVKQPRCLVRSQTKLPAQMGGGTVTMELQSIGNMTAK
ncbi:prolyl oligopeptidase family serine peptidase [candidate division KSB1 bacterium]|nr:prolyl oligopeptidase family serine peptidase [candidate division KSB1 bacterium]NIR69414.1 prolyl oligopeptidase family serine peptidase [candidate division KSB1 bacterium]NIS24212.1 prolyl oligopeptidase family serine peptidase [candidate division KSB1 bacterium]NIT71126.1 prolyl oligopeptidase family serine peptidase [candidate division KSB1 bacterium]NIU24831.1 prolyl oligopeptidase family serine peptidase [candidate division KSB1 bacterium]